jgi:exodeoxyribonuclease VII large subunit
MARKPFDPQLALGGEGPQPPKSNPAAPLSVWQVTMMVKEALDRCLPPTLHVVGQMSNVKAHTSGHLYFTLKDERSELPCVMWRSDAGRLKFRPADGLDVIATGEVGVFERSGRYQLHVRALEPRGVGALELAFRQLCAKLQAEGLFAAERKKPLPRYPFRIGVITSPTGAAIQDILNTLQRRFPAACVYVHPVSVQGPGAASAIAAAIETMNRRSAELGGIEVLIVGRGGGSAEDLWAFNEEVVARAIAASAIPIVSAVGHETDFSVADLVADVRAATPTAAAELVVPDWREVADELTYRADALTRLVRHRCALATAAVEVIRRRPLFDPLALVSKRRAEVAQFEQRLFARLLQRVQRLERRVAECWEVLQRLHPQRFLAEQERRVAQAEMILSRSADERLRHAEHAVFRLHERLLALAPHSRAESARLRLEHVEQRVHRAVRQAQRQGAERVATLAHRLEAMSHKATLARGFTITRDRKGRVIRSPAELREGTRIVTEFAEGSVESKVVDASQGELFD